MARSVHKGRGSREIMSPAGFVRQIQGEEGPGVFVLLLSVCWRDVRRSSVFRVSDAVGACVSRFCWYLDRPRGRAGRGLGTSFCSGQDAAARRWDRDHRPRFRLCGVFIRAGLHLFPAYLGRVRSFVSSKADSVPLDRRGQAHKKVPSMSPTAGRSGVSCSAGIRSAAGRGRRCPGPPG